MKVADIMVIFQQMPASDRLYLLCKMLQGSLTYELNFISIALCGYLKERLAGVSEVQANANKTEYYSTLTEDTPLVSRECLEIFSACLSLIHHDNKQVGDEVFRLLDQRNILSMAEEIEDLTLFENLRLVYVMAVYHPSLTFQRRHHLLTVFLHQLDEIYNSKVAEIKAKELEEREAAFEQNRPPRPADSAHIVRCQLIGFYKRQTDRRYAYVIEVEWSDGALCNVQRTYGDFFGFQNKLLDLFPDESGQKNKKLRVIPFLPGRRLLSGKSNRELAEKRLPDLWNYTRDLFQLPDHISSCSHLRDFFRPHLSDQRDISLLHKLTTLSDIRESTGKSRHPSAPPGVISGTSPFNSPKSRSAFFLGALSNSRNAQTLPPEKSPGPKRDMKVTKHATLPIQSAFTPISPNTPTSSTEKLHSSSQTSLGSIDRVMATPTTTACHVVTPTVTRANGSPAFAVSQSLPLTSSSWSNILSVPQTESPPTKLVKPVKLVKPTKLVKPVKLDNNEPITNSQITDKEDSTVTITTTTMLSSIKSINTTTASVSITTANVTTSNWAECSPPVTTDPAFYFSTHESPSKVTSSNTTPNSSNATANSSNATSNSLNATPNSSVFRPIQSMPTKRDTTNIVPSPSLTQLYYGGGGSQPSYRSYPVSYTPTNFESSNPSPGMGGRWQSMAGQLCTTPTNQITSESDQCRKWLKVHRLHKYENLFQNMVFNEVSSLTIDQLKDMGMTLGAAKKLQQKMEELKQANVQSFCDIPHSSLTRKPSTSSLPAAILLQERQGLTPSSSIDQLSLHGSCCSLDQTMGGTIHQPEGVSIEGVINSNIDCAIVETGPINGDGAKKNITNNHVGHNMSGGRIYRESVIRSKSSHTNTNSYTRNNLHTPSRSVDNTPSHSPLKVQRSLSPHQISQYRMGQIQSDQIRERIHSMPEKSPNRSSLPLTTPQQPQQSYHRKDIHSLPPNISDDHLYHHQHHHHHKLPQVFVSPNRVPNWSMTPPILHGMISNSNPMVQGRIPSVPMLPPGYQQTFNGLVQSPPIGPPHTGLHRLPSYPISGGVAMHSNSPSCYNCGQIGHCGSNCFLSKTNSSPNGDYHFLYTNLTPSTGSSNLSQKDTRK